MFDAHALVMGGSNSTNANAKPLGLRQRGWVLPEKQVCQVEIMQIFISVIVYSIWPQPQPYSNSITTWSRWSRSIVRSVFFLPVVSLPTLAAICGTSVEPLSCVAFFG